jgi:hypothetical protein
MFAFIVIVPTMLFNASIPNIQPARPVAPTSILKIAIASAIRVFRAGDEASALGWVMFVLCVDEPHHSSAFAQSEELSHAEERASRRTAVAFLRIKGFPQQTVGRP